MKSFNFLTLVEVLHLHDKLVERFGGSEGLRDRFLLESALGQPELVIFGEYAYKDIFQMAAAYLFHIIKNHPFIDGNKRTGLLVALTFLEKNGVIIDAKPSALYKITLSTAQSKITKEEIADFFKSNSRTIRLI